MTRGEAIKDFFYKTILPVAAAALLYCISRSACVKNGELDYLWLWINCLPLVVGLPISSISERFPSGVRAAPPLPPISCSNSSLNLSGSMEKEKLLSFSPPVSLSVI